MLRLELAGITKQYPAVRANDDVSLRVSPGQIHAVLGENGAGKSTLMKIIYGAVQPDAGEVRWNGNPVTIPNTTLAVEALGVMEQRKITSIVVIDTDRRVEGVVHLHDLWRTEMV